MFSAIAEFDGEMIVERLAERKQLRDRILITVKVGHDTNDVTWVKRLGKVEGGFYTRW